MRFAKLLTAAGVEVIARSGDADVRQVVSDSRRAQAGACFVAIRGAAADGHDHIAEAVAMGASAIVCQTPRPAGMPSDVALACLGDTAAAAGPIAQAFRGWPARKLTAIGVTGTKGKTTTTYLIRHILGHVGRSVGLVGTIHYEFAGRRLPAPNTTPGAVELAELTAQMVAAGVTDMVMEVSSHALDQGRTAGVDFRAAAFTNLSGEHLDYHHTMDRYLAAKRQLFEGLAPGAFAVLNRDDRCSTALAGATRADVLWYGIDPPADVQARIDGIDSRGTRLELTYRGKSAPVVSSLVGRHNVSNCLAAAGVCLSLGLPLAEVAGALSRPLCVPGRYQRVPSAGPFDVLVDYAHTDDALDNALGAIRPLTAGRLIVMFGCGGDRDRAKRPRMARVAQRRADRIILTSDNPRTEDPHRILDEVLAGFDAEGRAKLQVEADRHAAIALAVAQAGPDDVVVLAGKGHEKYQDIGTQRIHFNDAQVAESILAERFGPVPAGRGGE